MILTRKTNGLVNETESVLVNPGPEPSEAAVVEASEDVNEEKCWLGQRKRNLPAKSASGGFRTGRVSPLPFWRRRDGFRRAHNTTEGEG